MRDITFLVLISVLISCSNEKSIQKKRIGNRIIESNFIEDSIYDGPTRFFNLNGQLESLMEFSRGVKHGIGLNFYPNGNIHDSSTYLNGLKNGWHYVYDTTGQLTFKNYFFYGQNIGEEVFYLNGKPFQYSFLNFEKKRLFSCEYDSIGMEGFSGDILNVSSYVVYTNGIKQQGVFVYLIQPPTISVDYSLGLIDEKSNARNEFFQLKKETGFFKDTVLPLPNEGWKYYVAAHYSDTINKFEKVYVSVIEN